jgi:hypothetical protein
VPQRIEPREGYLAIVFYGAVERGDLQAALTAEPALLNAIRTSRRLLFELSDVTSFAFDPESVGISFGMLARQGLKIAISSSNPEYFGVGRQIAQLSGVEGSSINVFRGEPEAIGWLMDLVE